ncbi:MAG TPA: hypothetical protein VFY06_00080 [Verrucomicrobiae bacterium]|nr:hypothetical protein [Verrucomicrobiae bacterium]
MKLPRDSEIARVKVMQYLLKLRDEDDKSKFLAQAGYTLAQADQLLEDLSALLDGDAEFIQATEYGDKYRIRGTLNGPNGRQLRVSSVWMTEEATGRTKFVTLYPDKDEI